MAEGMDQILNLDPKYFCHRCSIEVSYSTDLLCRLCFSSFVEEVFGVNHSPLALDSYLDFGEDPLFGNDINFDHTSFISRMFNSLSHPAEPEAIVNEPESNEESEDRERFFGDLSFEGNIDAIASQFLNEGEISGPPPPLTQDQMKSLPIIAFTTEEEVNDRQCTVCMNDFKVGEKAKNLTCNHLFHKECIYIWFAKHASCPNCRSVVKAESKDKE